MAKSVYLQGRAKWARLSSPDQWGNWKVNLYLTPESKKIFEDLNVQNRIKRDDDGDFIILRRPTQKMIRGKVQGFSPPTVVDKDGAPAEAIGLGNGSDITVKLDYYSYKSPKGETGNAVRLSGVRIDNLVPFKPETDYTDAQFKAVGKLNEQPRQEDLF